MVREVILSACLLLLPAFTAAAQEEGPAQERAPTDAKELSGMSIVGNDEAPKSLYIVPWKSSELGAETSLNMLLDGTPVPVDRDVFLRQLTYYRACNQSPSSTPQP